MAALSDSLRSILGAPVEKTASLASKALTSATRVFATEKAVNRVVSDIEKAPTKSALKKSLRKALEEVKTASPAGQDLRSPFMGGSKMPTDDSKSFARKNLDMSKDKAEVGPAPLMAKLKPKGPEVKDVTPQVSSSTAGFLPKIGYVMHNDPLILYMQKEAAEKEAAAKAAMVMEDNADNTPKEQHWPDEMTTQDPTDSEFADDKGPTGLREYLNEKFDTTKGRRPKYFDVDHKAVSGMVDKVLKK